MDSCFSSTGEQLLTAGSDGSLTLWDFSKLPAQPILMGREPADLPAPLCSPDGVWHLQASATGLRLQGRPNTPAIQLNLHSQAGPFQFAADSSHFFAVDGTNVHLVDLARGQSRVLAHPNLVTHAAFSPDGLKLVCTSADRTFEKMSAQLWSVASGVCIGKPLQHDDGVRYAAFNPTSTLVITASEDFSAIIWDANSGRQLTPKLQHHEKVVYAAFARLHPWVVTCSDDNLALIWDASTGDQLTPPFRHRFPLTKAEFLDQDTALSTTDEKGNRWKWMLPIERRSPHELLKVARPLAGLAGPEE